MYVMKSAHSKLGRLFSIKNQRKYLNVNLFAMSLQYSLTQDSSSPRKLINIHSVESLQESFADKKITLKTASREYTFAFYSLHDMLKVLDSFSHLINKLTKQCLYQPSQQYVQTIEAVESTKNIHRQYSIMHNANSISPIQNLFRNEKHVSLDPPKSHQPARLQLNDKLPTRLASKKPVQGLLQQLRTSENPTSDQTLPDEDTTPKVASSGTLGRHIQLRPARKRQTAPSSSSSSESSSQSSSSSTVKGNRFLSPAGNGDSILQSGINRQKLVLALRKTDSPSEKTSNVPRVVLAKKVSILRTDSRIGGDRSLLEVTSPTYLTPQAPQPMRDNFIPQNRYFFAPSVKQMVVSTQQHHFSVGPRRPSSKVSLQRVGSRVSAVPSHSLPPTEDTPIEEYKIE